MPGYCRVCDNPNHLFDPCPKPESKKKMVRRVVLSSIFEANPVLQEVEVQITVVIAQPVADRWGRLVLRVNEQDQESARAFMVQRARKIWGRLGNLLRRSLWCQTFRATHFLPVRVLTYVRRWVPRGRNF